MIQHFGPWLIAIAAVWPIAIRLCEISGKPVDLVLTDFLYLLVVLTPPRTLLTIPEGTELKKLAAIRVSAVVCILYCLGLSLVGFAASTDLMRVVSAAKFVKPLTFVLLGSYLSMIFPPMLLLRRFATVFGLVGLATLGTTVANPAFPRCRWGEFLFAWETYGYPNSAMTFYGIQVLLLVSAADIQRRQTVRIFFRVAAVCTLLIVVASLSRSSIIAMTVGLGFYFFATGRGYIPVVAVVVGAILAVAGAGLMKLETDIETINVLQSAVEGRLEQTVDGDDPFAGRVGIWLHALELWSERPVFGFAFKSFSHYSVFDTPHQQYLEFLYKTGLVGAVLYLLVLLSGLIGLRHLLGRAQPKSTHFYQLNALLAACLGILVGNLSQPNLNYSLTGNTLFLMLGLVLTRHGAAELVPSSETLPLSISTGSNSGTPSTIIPDARAA